MRSIPGYLYRLHNLFILLYGRFAENPALPCPDHFATGCYVSSGRIQKNIDKFRHKTNDRYLTFGLPNRSCHQTTTFFSDENNQQYSLTS